jgi:hypothetical protein
MRVAENTSDEPVTPAAFAYRRACRSYRAEQVRRVAESESSFVFAATGAQRIGVEFVIRLI